MALPDDALAVAHGNRAGQGHHCLRRTAVSAINSVY